MIFLSHSDRDRGRLSGLVAELRARGVEVWFAPQEVRPGDSFVEQMNGALGRAERLLIAWSRDASVSEHVLNELRAFYEAHPRPGRILFMRLDETEVPTLFKDRLYFRPTGDDAQDAAVIEDWAAGQGNSELLRLNKALEHVSRNLRDSKVRALVERIAPYNESVRHDPLIRELMREPARHELHDFPRGPMVELHRVPDALVRSYASLLDTRAAAHALVHKASRLRLEADPGDPGVTFLGLEYLPAFEAGAYSFWQSAFNEACRHGPRMLAALLLAQPHEQFTHEARRDRARLLDHLRALKSARG